MDCPHCKSHQVGMICEIKKSHSFKKVAAYVGTGLLGVAGGIMLITPGCMVGVLWALCLPVPPGNAHLRLNLKLSGNIVVNLVVTNGKMSVDVKQCSS